MRNIALVIGYDGTAYSGFQTQPGGNTIQDKLEEAIRQLTGETVKLYGSGRTDAGVHARAQVANFHTDSAIPADRWPFALNTRLPADIRVYGAWEAEPDFHARKSAKRKTYRYRIERSRHPDLFHSRTRLHHPRPLDIPAMKQALGYVQGEHDFTSFCSIHSVSQSHVRTIYEARLDHERLHLPGDDQAELITIELTGNGFLYNMVRIIVGTVIEVGQGKRAPEEIRRILLARDRAQAGPTAPAHGLILWQVQY